MIILSAGMPRAGSGWYYNLTNDLVVAAGYQDGRKIRQQFHLGGILTEVNCNIGALTPRRLSLVWLPSLMGKTFVIKAHAGPTPMALRFIRLGWMRVAYIYRDPRDAMLSAYENGQKAREKGQANAFSRLVDFETSLDFIEEYCRVWRDWSGNPYMLHTRYEDLLDNYDSESLRLVSFLGLDTAQPEINQVVEQYRPAGAAQSAQKGLHFSQGRTGRFRQKYTTAQQDILNERLGPYLQEMEYEVP